MPASYYTSVFKLIYSSLQSLNSSLHHCQRDISPITSQVHLISLFYFLTAFFDNEPIQKPADSIRVSHYLYGVRLDLFSLGNW